MNKFIKHIVEDFDFTAVKQNDFFEDSYNDIFKKILHFETLTTREWKWYFANLGNYAYKYVLTDVQELRDFLWQTENGPYNIRFRNDGITIFDLNWIDVSNIKDMTKLFFNINRPYNISKWDVSNVKHMWEMFEYSNCDWDIADWDVSNCIDFHGMFANTKHFNCDLSKWNVSEGLEFNYMFYNSNYNNDLSSWNIAEDAYIESMFHSCPIRPEYKPERLKSKITKFFDKIFRNKK